MNCAFCQLCIIVLILHIFRNDPNGPYYDLPTCAALCPVSASFYGFSFHSPPGICFCFYENSNIPLAQNVPAELSFKNEANAGTGLISSANGVTGVTCYKYIGP